MVPPLKCSICPLCPPWMKLSEIMHLYLSRLTLVFMLLTFLDICVLFKMFECALCSSFIEMFENNIAYVSLHIKNNPTVNFVACNIYNFRNIRIFKKKNIYLLFDLLKIGIAKKIPSLRVPTSKKYARNFKFICQIDLFWILIP